jgi:hypothetical protein
MRDEATMPDDEMVDEIAQDETPLTEGLLNEDPSVEELVDASSEDYALIAETPKKPLSALHGDSEEDRRVTPKMHLEAQYKAALQLSRNRSYPDDARRRFTDKAEAFKRELDKLS